MSPKSTLPTPQFENDFAEVVRLIQQGRAKAHQSAQFHHISTIWQVGQYVQKKLQASIWGSNTVGELVGYIKAKHPDLIGYDRRSLYRMVQFYDVYSSPEFLNTFASVFQSTQAIEIQSDTFVSTVLTQLAKLNWSHHLELLSGCKEAAERVFYIGMACKEKWNVRELRRQIKTSVFERTLLANQRIPQTISDLPQDTQNLFRDRYQFEFLNLPEIHSENDLQKGLIRNLKKFLLEMGKGFIFVGEEYRVQVGNKDFFIDLLLYNRELQCFVAIELKTVEFDPGHLGKLNFYLEALDRDHRLPHENPSIGILLCKVADQEIVEYATSRDATPAMIAEYEQKLIPKAMLQAKLHELGEYLEGEE